MPSPTVTRYPQGLCDDTQDGAWNDFAGLRPNRYAEYFDDYFSFLATQWILTETAAGSTETVATTGDGGWLSIVNVAAGAADEASLQWAGGNAAAVLPFTFDPTKDMFIAAKVKVDLVATTAFLIGLAVVDTTPVASLPSDGIFFSKPAGAAVTAQARAAGVSSTAAMGSMADNTFAELAFVYTVSDGLWRAYLNGNYVAGFATVANTPLVPLTMTIGLLNASAAAHSLSLDYLFVGKQR